MATVRANNLGEIIQFLQTPEEETQYAVAPPETAYSFRFDETTNAGLIAQYNVNSNIFSMPGGTITVNGVAATINPPSLVHTALSRLPNLIAKLQGGDAFTTQEQKQLLAVLLRGAGRI